MALQELFQQQQMDTDKDNGLHPRLCVLRITPEHHKYGFDIKVDDVKHAIIVTRFGRKSVASAGGLRKGHHIIEINGENVENLTQPEIHHRIKSSPEVLRVLVLKEEDWNRAKTENILIHGSMPSVKIIDTSQPLENQAFDPLHLTHENEGIPRDPEPYLRQLNSPPYPQQPYLEQPNTDQPYPWQLDSPPYPKQPYPELPYPRQPETHQLNSLQAPFPPPPPPGPIDESHMDPQNQMIIQEKPPRPPDYTILSAVVCIFCCCLIGMFGIIFAVQAKKQYNVGNIERAGRLSRRAKICCFTGIGLGIIVITVSNVVRKFV